jgi:hypothetical protein
VTEIATKIEITLVIVTIATETKIGIETEIDSGIDTMTEMVTAIVIVTVRKVMPSFRL